MQSNRSTPRINPLPLFITVGISSKCKLIQDVIEIVKSIKESVPRIQIVRRLVSSSYGYIRNSSRNLLTPNHTFKEVLIFLSKAKALWEHVYSLPQVCSIAVIIGQKYKVVLLFLLWIISRQWCIGPLICLIRAQEKALALRIGQ